MTAISPKNFVPPDAALKGALQASEAAGLPAINVAPNQGKLLELLARVQGARRILEIGTPGGYSTIWLARALVTGGKLLTLESEPKHTEVTRRNIARAGADVYWSGGGVVGGPGGAWRGGVRLYSCCSHGNGVSWLQRRGRRPGQTSNFRQGGLAAFPGAGTVAG